MALLVQINQLAPSAIGSKYILTSVAGIPEYRPAVSADASNIVSLGTDRGIFAAPALDDLIDVVAPAPAVDDVIKWDGVNWVNSPLADFGEYQTVFDASSGVFPGGGGIVASDWFNVSVAGIVDGQSFSIGDLLIAIVNTPSNITYAGNWMRVSPVGSFSQFTVSGDAGPAQTILNLNNLGILGGTNITTTMSAGDIVTIDWGANITDLTDVDTTGVAVNSILRFDGANWVISSVPALETTTTIAGALGAGNTIGTYTNEDGVAVILRETTTTVTGALGAGNTIGTYNNEAGAAVILRETITDFLLSGSNIRFVDEAGVNNDIAISTLISTDAGNAVLAGGDGKLFVSAGAVVANLSLGPNTATTLDVLIDTGTDVTLPASTAALAGLMTAAQFNNLANLITLSGVAANATNLGTFTGVTIADNVTVKVALQSLETDLELQNLKFDILDEGVDTGAGEIISINFVGAGVTATQIGGAVTVTIPGGAESTTVTDTNSVNLTLTGFDITADVNISATAGNLASINGTGLLIKERLDQFDDVADGTTVFNLTVAPMANTFCKVFRNGVLEDPTAFTQVGTVVTFTNPITTAVGSTSGLNDVKIYYFAAS